MNMRSLLLLVLFLSSLVACRKRNGSDDTQKPATYDSTSSPFMQRTVVELTPYNKDSAWLQLPVHYNSGFDTEKYPLVIFLNGRFEGSDYGNLKKLLNWAVPKF